MNADRTDDANRKAFSRRVALTAAWFLYPHVIWLLCRWLGKVPLERGEDLGSQFLLVVILATIAAFAAFWSNAPDVHVRIRGPGSRVGGNG